MKRLFDFVLALVVGVLAAPVIAVIAILIRLESPGSPIFVQERVGRNEKVFRCYKLRTMMQGSPIAGSHEVSASRITRIGHFLRKTKLDELPQVINILRGEMSFVGPRPNLPVQQELVEKRRARNVFDAVPGITGLSQVRGIDMSTPDLLARSDREYLDTQSFAGDLKLIIASARGAGRGDAATRET